MDAANSLLARLLAQGDLVSMERGRLEIIPASGRPVPPDWLAQNRQQLIVDVACSANLMPLEFVDYSTGSYIVDTHTGRRADGVTLQFRCMKSGQDLYVIFNANTRRTRTTAHGKEGELLPQRHFTVGKRSAFLRFWKSTGLPYRRLSEFHDYMGNLAGLTYTATVSDGERMDASTLCPLTLTLDGPGHPGNRPTSSRQPPDNIPTRLPDKELPQSQQRRGIRPESTTGQEHHGKAVTRERGYTMSGVLPALQTTEEWLADYEAAGKLGI